MVNALKKLTNALSTKHCKLPKSRGRFINVEPILQPRIPILRAEHVNAVTGAQVEMDITVYNNLAVHRSRLLARYNKIDPRVALLVKFVKHWAKAHFIDDPRDGINSFGWTMMTIGFLQRCDPPIVPVLQSSVPGEGAR